MNNTSHRLGAGQITRSCVTDFIQHEKEKGFCQGFVISPNARARLLSAPLASWQHDANTGDHHHLMGELLRDCNIPALNPSGPSRRTVSETPISRYTRTPARLRPEEAAGAGAGAAWRTSLRREPRAEAAAAGPPSALRHRGHGPPARCRDDHAAHPLSPARHSPAARWWGALINIIVLP